MPQPENLDKQLADLEQMTPRQLQQRYAELFGEPAHSRNRGWLIKRVAWRLQANAEGDLSERARRRAEQLADDADLRSTAPRGWRESPRQQPPDRGSRLPVPGTTIQRDYKGRRLRVHVLEDGFEFEGRRYRTLSALAKQITGSHCSGHRFFGLAERGGAA